MGKLESVGEMFEGRHFSAEVIILYVRWYLRFELSLRDRKPTSGFALPQNLHFRPSLSLRKILPPGRTDHAAAIW
jgi:hypothetical protein